MNKKLMLASLLILASSVAYARVGETNLGEDYKNKFNQGVGSSGQIVDTGDIRWAGKDTFDKVQKEFQDVQSQLDGKADVDFVTQQADKVYNDLDELKADKSDVNDLYGKLGAVEADKNAIREEMEKADADLKNELDGKVDKGTFEDAYNEFHTNDSFMQETLNTHRDEIDALDKNKVDKDQYEADKQVQAGKDAAQDEAIAKGDRIDNIQNQQIGNLQSDNLEQDKQIQANKDQIAANKAEQDKVNAAQKENNDKQQSEIDTNRQNIDKLQQDFAQYDGRLSNLEDKVSDLDDRMNKGLSLMAAMNAVDFQNVEEGEMAIGAGVGHYGNAQSVAVGVAYSPTANLNLNAKYSVTAGDVDSFAIGAGASYKFKIGR